MNIQKRTFNNKQTHAHTGVEERKGGHQQLKIFRVKTSLQVRLESMRGGMMAKHETGARDRMCVHLCVSDDGGGGGELCGGQFTDHVCLYTLLRYARDMEM